MRLIALILLMTPMFNVAGAEPAGTSFTYQGDLQQLGQPATGTFDFQFELFDVDSEGTAIGDTQLAFGAGAADIMQSDLMRRQAAAGRRQTPTPASKAAAA